MENKKLQLKNNKALYLIAQCLIMVNCFLCFLEIYESHLMPLSYGLIAVSIVLFFISGSYKRFRFSTISTSFMVLFCYLLLGDLINFNITTFTSQMCLSGLALFFFFSFFSGDIEDNRNNIKTILTLSVVVSAIISALSFILRASNLTNGAFQGITNQRNALAAYCLLGIIGFIYLFDLRKIFSLKNLLLLVSVVFNCYALYKTESRSPLMVLMAFIAIMFLYFLCVFTAKKKGRVLLITICILVIALVFFVAISFIVTRNNPSFGEESSIRNIINKISSGRLSIWESCIELTKESPVFGVKDARYDELMMERIGIIYSPHNVYFSLMTVNGIPALLIYLFIIGYTIVSAIRLIIKLDNNEDKKRIFFYLAILIGYLVGDLFECFSIRSYMPSAYIVILMFSAIEAERLNNGKKV